jgi:threonylcarbamoyladenosine tRNA methylthiotransferase MtaB
MPRNSRARDNYRLNHEIPRSIFIFYISSFIYARIGTNRFRWAFEAVMSSQIQKPRVAVHTLGCKLNYAETSSIARQFSEAGYAVTPFGGDTDIFLLNTCSVTENAEKECRQIIRRVLRRSPNARVIVTGCYAQLRPEEIASIEGVDLVLGAKEKFEAVRYFTMTEESASPKIFANEIADATEFHAAVTPEEDGRTRAFLKVQDGCDYSCSFCTIPKARGVSRSADVQEIVDRAVQLCDEGFHEIVLSGVNVGDFGRKIGPSFYDLLYALEEESRITARIRISSIEPNLLTDDIIELASHSGKMCPHFHIPLQSGSAKILRAMQRRYIPETYRRVIGQIKSVLPEACIGADVIVGFPGETDEDFRNSYDFIQSLDLSYLHVFTYSERPGTKAASMAESVPIATRKERNRMLRIFSEKRKRTFYGSLLGREVNVLLERKQSEMREGFSEHYARVRLSATVPDRAEMVRVRLDAILGDIIVAEPLEVFAESRRKQILLPIL